ncbi:MAG: family 10 glycosylhydrolase, partial [Gemmatimonadaceae bacterium]
VERMYRETHALKPTIKEGISPFGIWRPGFPTGVNGLDAYASIYADSRKWLQQGWVDYLAPQLYWSIAAPQQSYTALLDWWLSQNSMGRNVWPGLAAYRVNDGTTSAYTLQEIPDQIRLARARTSGTLLYNTTWTLTRNSGTLASTLAGDLFKTAALVPASPWLDATAPGAPTLIVAGSTLNLVAASGEQPRWWAVRQRSNEMWSTRILFRDVTSMTLAPSVNRLLVQSVDQAGNASTPAEWRR